MEKLEKIVLEQKEYFNTHVTLDVNFRLLQLKRLKLQIRAYYEQIVNAFKKDLNKCEFDVVSNELGMVMNEINYMIKHLPSLAKTKRVSTSIINFPSHGEKIYEPFGTVLIASPWNYPLQLSLIPLIGAIAGGNVVVLKPSRSTPNVSKVIKKMLSIFDSNYVYVLSKDDDIESLFDTKFDFIFYTGSVSKARELMAKQAQYLTPMVLELGGKSPCIVDEDANVDLSAKRIVWGKFLNAGQTCVAPDYVLVHYSVKEHFVESVKKYIQKFYYNDGKLSTNFVHIVNKKAVERLQNVIDMGKVVFGGKVTGQVIEPTVMDNVTKTDKIMQEEIFGPVMPIISFENFDNELAELNQKEKPLALYYFGKNKQNIEKVKNCVSFGGGCINDVIMHLSEEKLPFGGVGNSGMGSYHGKKSFLTFTHEKSVLVKSTHFEINTKYPPVTKGKLKLTKKIFKV